ncbi:Hypothetical predicted protein [Pelobates cultripes]|uniref:Uncharacterized protein n=1 Tax=Pelobates cultripes TaxID=61616 RepID=A0AAD1RAW2_PELCU|nr:Hypothetical predicted protein [Pelobates cultripes]
MLGAGPDRHADRSHAGEAPDKSGLLGESFRSDTCKEPKKIVHGGGEGGRPRDWELWDPGGLHEALGTVAYSRGERGGRPLPCLPLRLPHVDTLIRLPVPLFCRELRRNGEGEAQYSSDLWQRGAQHQQSLPREAPEERSRAAHQPAQPTKQPSDEQTVNP